MARGEGDVRARGVDGAGIGYLLFDNKPLDRRVMDMINAKIEKGDWNCFKDNLCFRSPSS